MLTVELGGKNWQNFNRNKNKHRREKLHAWLFILNTLKIVLKYELSKVRNLGNEMWQHVHILYKNGSEHYSKKWYYKKVVW